MKKIFAIAISFALILAITGCGSSKDKAEGTTTPAGSAPTAAVKDDTKPVTLRMAWWGAQPRHDYTIKVIEMYQKLHPNVKIEYEYATFDEHWKKMAPQAAANQLPDIINMDFSYLAQYGLKDQLEDLTPYTASGLLDVSDISESALSGGKLNGKLFGMNLGVNALSISVDPAVLKANNIPLPDVNWTWDDFEKYGTQLKDKGIFLTGNLVPEQFFAYYLRQNDQHLYNADGTALGYTDDKYYVDYFSRLQRLVEAKVMYTPAQTAQVKAPEDDDFIKGKMAFGFGYSNGFGVQVALAKRELALVPMPGPNSNKGLFLKPSMFFSIAKSSKQKEEAAKFISYFVNDIEANKLIKGDRGVPVAAKVKEAVKAIVAPEQAKVFEYVAWAEKNSSQIDPPDPIGSAEITKVLRDLQDQIFYKKITPEAAAPKFMKQANDILAKNKK
jgi:multiple sugar transport system substrate-binding protein